MSLKQQSLGSASAAARGIVMSAIDTGNPAHIVLTAGHRLRNGNRIAIAGNNTSDLGTFGEWTISGLSATSGTLEGCTAAAALSGTPVIAVLCDRTPFLPKHSAVVCVTAGVGAAATDGIGTVVLEGADSVIAANFQYTNSSGVATTGFKDVTKSGEIAMAFNDFGSVFVEVDLTRYMTMRVSAWTSGTFGAHILA
jgi:hypothetical protein